MADPVGKGKTSAGGETVSAAAGYPDHTHLLDKVRGMRVLIADSRASNVALLQAVLKQGGFTRLTISYNGADTLEHLRRSLPRDAEPIGAILLGFDLNDTDGFTLCRAVRDCDEWAGVPIIMVNSRDEWDELQVRQAYAAGATDILFKPVRSVELLPRLVSALCLKEEWQLRRHRERELLTELAELKVLEARLQYLVGHDDLTGLYNRRHLEQALEASVLNARRHNRTSALLYLDLDQFKIINNYEGHCAGDDLLVRVANILRKQMTTDDLIAHISSDEYAVLLDNSTLQHAMNTAEKLRRALSAMHFSHNNKIYQIGASIGIAMVTDHKDLTASEVLARADQACFAAKRHGRNMVHLYSADDTELVTLRSNAEWLPTLREALSNDGFRLVFQPLLHIGDGTVQNYEVLTRMVNRDGEMIDNMDFIGVAERLGLIHDLDRWVVGRAIEVMRDLPDRDSDICLNINLSGHAFQDNQLLPLVRHKLRDAGVSAERITFEITETAAIENFARTRKMVKQLRALGCRFALDDFGSGFNSYNYLKQFPVDYLKIDGNFITDLVRDPVDQALVKSMAEIARTLGKQTIAEFVCDAETLTMVKSFGIDYAQGYYIGMPQSAPFGTRPVSSISPNGKRLRN
jgi:diguanylate cyclase (GGDEF)-like protein